MPGRALVRAITWQQADLLEWQPQETYDLVTSNYVHVPGGFEELLGRLASWAASGGTLLIVGHHPEDPRVREHPAKHVIQDAVSTVDQFAAALDHDEWEVSARSATHTVRQADQEIEFLDTVLRAVRRPGRSRGGAQVLGPIAHNEIRRRRR